MWSRSSTQRARVLSDSRRFIVSVELSVRHGVRCLDADLMLPQIAAHNVCPETRHGSGIMGVNAPLVV